MSALETMLLSAIGALAAVIVFLYFDQAKDRKTHVKLLKDAADNFASAIKELSSSHQKQEEQIYERHEKTVDDMVREHKREMAGMVERVLEASRNDKEHDRVERDRILALAESLGHRAQWSRGGRGS